VREVAQLLHRLLDVAADLLEHGVRSFGIVLRDLAHQVDAHRQRDEVLLRAVVEVALDASTLRVAGLHDPRA